MTDRVAQAPRSVPASVLAVVALIAAVFAGVTTTRESAHAAGHTADRAMAPAMAMPSAVRTKRSFHDHMRKLWEDHITWTRLAIVTFVDGSGGFNTTAGRLLQNQSDIGDAFKPFYGKKVGNAVTSLLEDHINIAVEILQAAKAGDQPAFDDAKARWYANGRDIADALHSLNPKRWLKAEMRSMMRTHLDQTLTEASAELTGDYAASVASYEHIHHHILAMADTLSSGIIHQFPNRF